MVKNLPANMGDVKEAGSIPRSGRSPGGEHGTPLQYSCLENPMDRGAWQATVHGITKELDMMELLNSSKKSYRKSVDYCMIPMYPRWLSGKESVNAGDVRGAGLISGSGRSPGGEHGSPLQYFSMENPMDRGAWQTTVHDFAKESDTT